MKISLSVNWIIGNECKFTMVVHKAKVVHTIKC